jgi:hypothetical protein
MKDGVQLVEAYIRSLHEIHQTGAGVKEESYYGSLENLFNGIGKSLKPQVRCIMQLMNRGAGHPDGGLFTKEQRAHGNQGAPLLGQTPSRGVVEVKPTSDDTWITANSKQISKYWNKYQLVLVTNYRDFLLVGRDKDGNPVKLESYRLAASEEDFWVRTAHPLKLARQYSETFVEYLKRAMLQSAQISSLKDLAWFLASYARTANSRLVGKDIPAMDSVRSALEAALGLKFEGKDGEHFFRSTLVQTVFYGLFSAWALWYKKYFHTPAEKFDWRTAVWHLQVPVMQALFYQIVTPTHVGPLELEDTLDWATATLNRVDGTSFFSDFEEGKAVQYFYEPFLEAFDPELRKQLGVWYTPPEIVQYMVTRVDIVLKEELNIADGLADPHVFILDPCCGTGSYLIEALRRIYQNLKSKGVDALLASDLKQAALKRVFGFEILPAPFIVSHMQLGLLLQNLGAPLLDTNHERAGVYLTNALTGWEPLDPEKEKAFQAMLTGFPELLEEQADARKVKQQVPILVILGNPPYNAFAGTATTKEERDSVAPYKEGLIKKWGIKKFNLDELYVRFFRMAEHRIVDQTGQGIVCLISNFSYLSDPSFVVMREHFLKEFDTLWIDNLNGDSRETGKRTPEGKPDPSVFSTEYNREGIRVGTVVSLFVRKKLRVEKPIVRYQDFWGSTKKTDLLNSLNTRDITTAYQFLIPEAGDRYLLRPLKASHGYKSWPSVYDFAEQQPFPAFMESRRGAFIDINEEDLEKRMMVYYDKEKSWETIKKLRTGLTRNAAGYDALKAREKTLKGEAFNYAQLLRYSVRPFDTQWCYYTKASTLWHRSRPELWAQCWIGNSFIVTRMKTEKEAKGSPLYFSRCLVDYQSLARNVSVIPIHYRVQTISNNKPKEQAHLIQPEEETKVTANLSSSARHYLALLGVDNLESPLHSAALIWMHTLAIGYSPTYLQENSDNIRVDWPRIPLPEKKELLEDSATLGEQVAALLDTENPVAGVTALPIRAEIQGIALVTKEDGGQLQPKELAMTAGWGYAGKDGAVMPGKGKAIKRDYTAEEKQTVARGASQLGISQETVLELLGDYTFDIYLNDVAYWKNIPKEVWDYTIGGYQVIKKWLSYRENDLLGRPLTSDEAREVMNMARRITAIILLQPSLDENYKQCKENVYDWPNKNAGV